MACRKKSVKTTTKRGKVTRVPSRAKAKSAVNTADKALTKAIAYHDINYEHKKKIEELMAKRDKLMNKLINLRNFALSNELSELEDYKFYYKSSKSDGNERLARQYNGMILDKKQKIRELKSEISKVIKEIESIDASIEVHKITSDRLAQSKDYYYNEEFRAKGRRDKTIRPRYSHHYRTSNGVRRE